MVDDMVQYCKENERNGKPLIEDPFVRDELAKIQLQIWAMRALGFRSAWEQSKGEDVTTYASGVKVLTADLLEQVAGFVTHELGGLAGQMRLGSPWAVLDGVWESFWENALGQPINVGHNDIQHNVIATWGLKLPRS